MDQFYIYEINEHGSQFKEVRKKKTIPIKTHSEKLKAYLENIEDCRVVICNKIGKKPKIELRKRGIKVILVECPVKYAVEQCSQHMIN